MTRLKLRLHAGFISQLSATGWFKTLETHTTHTRMLVWRFYIYTFVWFTLKGSTDKTQLMANQAKASHAEKVLQASALSSFMARRFATQQLDMESVCIFLGSAKSKKNSFLLMRFFLMNQLGVNILRRRDHLGVVRAQKVWNIAFLGTRRTISLKARHVQENSTKII